MRVLICADLRAEYDFWKSFSYCKQVHLRNRMAHFLTKVALNIDKDLFLELFLIIQIRRMERLCIKFLTPFSYLLLCQEYNRHHHFRRKKLAAIC